MSCAPYEMDDFRRARLRREWQKMLASDSGLLLICPSKTVEVDTADDETLAYAYECHEVAYDLADAPELFRLRAYDHAHHFARKQLWRMGENETVLAEMRARFQTRGAR